MTSIPHDLDAERHVIGCCLLRRESVADLVNSLSVTDFYSPAHGATWSAIVELWNQGTSIDAHTVSTHDRNGLSGPALVSAMGAVPSTTGAGRYARTLVEHTARRGLLRIARELTEQAMGPTDPADATEIARMALDEVDLPGGQLPADLYRLADLMSKPESEQTPWVIPGLFRQDWRVVVVAPEGKGKSLVLQQVGIAAAQGVHPFSFEPIPPMRVLFVDLENPEERILHGARLIDPHVRRSSKAYDDDRVWIWSRQGGINLRNRRDRSTLEAVLEELRPQLVCMGPAYKTTEKEKGEGWDEAALATQRVLDQLRVRYKFALLMEDHAPQSSGGTRDLRPFGSSMWLRWPEIGLKLIPDDETGQLRVGHWRGDRLPNGWPDAMDRGREGSWPWEGYWENPGRRSQYEGLAA